MTSKPSGFFYGQNMSDITHHIAEAGTATMQTKIAYTASGAGLVVSGLTINELVGVMVGVASIITMIVTAYSNHKRNKMQMRVLQRELSSCDHKRKGTCPEE